MSSKSALINRRLYRALLRAVKPFTPPSPNFAVLSCLLHRSYSPIEQDEEIAAYRRHRQRYRHNLRDEDDDEGDYAYAYAFAYSDDDDNDDDDDTTTTLLLSSQDSDEEDEDDPHFLLFRRTLWTLFADGHTTTTPTYYNPLYQSPSKTIVPNYQIPNQVHDQPTRLLDLIRQEFRVPTTTTTTTTGGGAATAAFANNESYLSAVFPIKARRDAAFLALRRLNEKLAWADQLEERQRQQQQQQQQQLSTTTSSPPQLSPKQSAKHVKPLWKAMKAARNEKRKSLSPYLQPGIFLVAHPHMTGFFHQTVICILQHQYINNNNGVQDHDDDDHHHHDDDNDDEESKQKTKKQEQEQEGGTYGLIVNRPSINEATGRNRTLADSLNFQLPHDIATPLGTVPIKNGGPVNMPSIQMLHSFGYSNDGNIGTNDDANANANDEDDDETKAEDSNIIGGTMLPSVTEIADEKVVSYQGDIMKAAQAVSSGQLDRDDVSFFVGASCWYPGQLEKEIRQGCWLLCSGPPEIALSGVCEQEPTEDGEPRPKADLWLSMMAAFGEDEANLAYLMQTAQEDDEYGGACDGFQL